MTTEGRAGVMIDVILDEGNVIACLHLAQRVQQQSVTRKIVNNGVAQTHAFRRRVLDVAHVEITAATVEQKASVTRRLLVIAIVQGQRARARLPATLTRNVRRPGLAPKGR